MLGCVFSVIGLRFTSRRASWEVDFWVCELDMLGTLSMLRAGARLAGPLPQGGPPGKPWRPRLSIAMSPVEGQLMARQQVTIYANIAYESRSLMGHTMLAERTVI